MSTPDVCAQKEAKSASAPHIRRLEVTYMHIAALETMKNIQVLFEYTEPRLTPCYLKRDTLQCNRNREIAPKIRLY